MPIVRASHIAQVCDSSSLFRPCGCALPRQSQRSVTARGETSPFETKNHNTEKEQKRWKSKHRPKRKKRTFPKWSALLVEAVNKPGLIMKAYSAFHSYSLGNQLLALVQCQMRGLQPGPINTFPKWKELGRHVKPGERALTLCMPITCKRRNDTDDDESDSEGTFTSFVYKPRWFVLSQTDGEELQPQVTPEWDAKRIVSGARHRNDPIR